MTPIALAKELSGAGIAGAGAVSDVGATALSGVGSADAGAEPGAAGESMEDVPKEGGVGEKEPTEMVETPRTADEEVQFGIQHLGGLPPPLPMWR